MQIKQFEYVRTIAQQGSIKVAAEKLYISQQALSESIQSLETELEFQIFQRTNRGVVLTEQGEKFIQDIDTIMPIVYGWKEYKHKPKVKLLVQYALSDLLLDTRFLQYLSADKQVTLQYETANLNDILKEIVVSGPCLALLIIRDSNNYNEQLKRMKESERFVFEELVGLENSQMSILMQTNQCPLKSGESIDMQALEGKTLVVNKDMLQLSLVKQISEYTKKATHGLPYTIKAADIVAQNRNAITFLPKFIADRNFYVKMGLLSAYPMEQCIQDYWNVYLLYDKQWKKLLRFEIDEMKKCLKTASDF